MKRLLCIALILASFFAARADRGVPEMKTVYEPRTVTIRCAGDFVMHMALVASGQRAGTKSQPSFAHMLSEVKGYLSEADFTVTNVDGVMGDKAFVAKYGYSGYPAFSTPAELIDDLRDCGVDMLTLANNHALDLWYDGLKSTVGSVEAAGLMSVGGYRTLEEKLTPRVADIGGIRFGFLNYTDGLNQMDKRAALDKAALEYGVDFWERADLKADIRRLKDAGAEIIVCFMHWGIEYRVEPCASQKQNAKILADAGVDVIIGGHPHYVERAEYIPTVDENGQSKQVLCLYSLGNFLTGQRGERRDSGIIFDFTVTRDEEGRITVSDPVYRTVWVWCMRRGDGNDYRVLFTDRDAQRPKGMSDADWKRMRESALEIKQVMDAGCARPALEPEPEVEAPSR
ncbi:MAG: CapA family protein [Clostridia bacterium]|nr:CapA family protein [Clostridia bacterium]MBR5751264.1 CapA family protein [Clostridia bacterium]